MTADAGKMETYRLSLSDAYRTSSEDTIVVVDRKKPVASYTDGDNLPLVGNMTATFDEPVYRSGALQVQLDGKDVNATFDQNTMRLTIPYGPFDYNTEHKVNIVSGLVDIAGNTIENPETTVRIKPNRAVDVQLNYATGINEKLIKNKTYALNPVLVAEDPTQPITNTKLIFTSSNPKVATVTAAGVVKAIGVGKATITIKHEKDEFAPKTIDVVFAKNPVTKIKLNKTKLTLKRKKTYQLKATVYPSYATYKTVKWTTSNKKLATVSKTGKVKALKKKGKVKITAIADGKKAVCTITIK